VTEFIVTNTRALHATQWCMDEFSEDGWEIEMIGHQWGTFKFKFEDPHQATLFALKWAE